MKHAENKPLVTTVPEHCRVCYTCVRECPAKAIRIADGQAEVLPERCIACGNCVRVCSQKAKQVLDSTEHVKALLKSSGKVAACLAPSFPAEFNNDDYRTMVGMIRALGFDLVNEVSFGADLVAREYRNLLARDNSERYVATTCPAILSYVEKYHPKLIGNLAPIVSPMIATARALKEIHGKDIKIVFIGPCIAKKGEASSELVAGEVDSVLTFAELRSMLEETGVKPKSVPLSDFDPPHGYMGALFPVSRGLLQAADIQEDIMVGAVIATDGRSNFAEALKEFEAGHLDAKLLEVLCCEGCIMGAGMTNPSPQFSRRSQISRYVRDRIRRINPADWNKYMTRFADLDLSRKYQSSDQRIPDPPPEELAKILARIGKENPEDELNCGACGYDTCREHAVAIFKGLAESEMCLPYTIDQLKKTVQDLASTNDTLANTKEALLHSERLASMGQLAAGIAHEVNNPLGVVLMYAHLLLEEAGSKSENAEDLKMIVQQADRCKKIVAGLLHFARPNKVALEPVDAKALVNEAVKSFPEKDNIEVTVNDLLEDKTADLDHDQMMQVLTNLMSNAAAAMPEGGVISITMQGDEEEIRLTVADTGTGIPEHIIPKVFEPFFTTKQIDKGTGLGLAVTYGIVKMHRGKIRVESNTDPEKGPTGTTFTVILPRHEVKEPLAESVAMLGDEQKSIGLTETENG